MALEAIILQKVSEIQSKFSFILFFFFQIHRDSETEVCMMLFMSCSPDPYLGLSLEYSLDCRKTEELCSIFEN